jgi:hypothetical protein
VSLILELTLRTVTRLMGYPVHVGLLSVNAQHSFGTATVTIEDVKESGEQPDAVNNTESQQLLDIRARTRAETRRRSKLP